MLQLLQNFSMFAEKNGKHKFFPFAKTNPLPYLWNNGGGRVHRYTKIFFIGNFVMRLAGKYIFIRLCFSGSNFRTNFF